MKSDGCRQSYQSARFPLNRKFATVLPTDKLYWI